MMLVKRLIIIATVCMIMLCAAFAEAEEAAQTEPLDVETEYCLPTDYLSFLQEHEISMDDGSIVITSVEQMVLIRDYYKQYLIERGIDYVTGSLDKMYFINDINIMDYIINLNFAFISDEVKLDLVQKGLVTYPIFTHEYPGYVVIAIYENMGAKAKENDISFFISNLPVIFDCKIRQCVALEEQYLKKYISYPSKTNEYSCLDGYIMEYDDYSRFLLGKKSNFPYKMKKLDSSAPYTFYIITLEQQMINICGGGALYSPLSAYATSSDTYSKVYPAIKKHVEAFTQP